MPLQYLLDENITPAYRTQLQRRLPSLIIRIVGDPGAPAPGTLDPEILLWCEAYDFVLVTNNRRSMPSHLAGHLAAGHHVPGIVTISPDRGIAANLEELVLIAELSLPGEYADVIKYLPL